MLNDYKLGHTTDAMNVNTTHVFVEDNNCKIPFVQ